MRAVNRPLLNFRVGLILCYSRVGISIEDEKDNFELPADIREMNDKWVISERKDGLTTWDFLWNGSAEEGREKQALDEAFVLEIDDAVTPAKDNEYLTVAESAMKVSVWTFSTLRCQITRIIRWYSGLPRKHTTLRLLQRCCIMLGTEQ